MDERKFPDITFVDSDTESIANEMIEDYQSRTGKTLYPADPVRVLLLYVASVISQERAITNNAAKQNVPRFAKNSYLDSLCEIFRGVERLSAVPAHTSIVFEISEPQGAPVVIPAGTRVTADGSVMFATISEGVIPVGEIAVETTAECTLPGTIGNGYLPKQISVCVDVFPYYKSVENTTESGGGADTETDAELYERMRASVDGYSTAGAAGAYIYHAKSASALVADVTATSPSAGKVDVRVLCKGGKLPSEELIHDILNALNDEKVRPLTDLVAVSAPKAISFNITLTYFINDGSGMSITSAENEVMTAVDKYIDWQTAKIGRDINPSYLIQLVMQTGIKRVEVTEPSFRTVGNTEAAQLGTITVKCGGYEND